MAATMKIMRKIDAKWNNVLTKASMISGLSLSKPSYVCAKMTMRCNSRCNHCDIWKGREEVSELSTEQWLRILRELREWLGRFRMVFTGGEALLREDMMAILDRAVGLGISVELLSNGLLIDEKTARRIVDTGIDQITISLDGITPEIHDSFRGGDGYHRRTTDAVLELSRQRREAGKPLRILLKTVISAHNLGELVAIANWAGSHGLEVQYQPIEQNYGEAANPGWYRTSSFWVNDLEKLRESLGVLDRIRREKGGIANTGDDFERFIEYFEHPEEMMSVVQAHGTGRLRKCCSHAVGSFVISSNGDVRMCFKMEPIGNLGAQSPRKVWQGRERCWAVPCAHR